MSNTHHQGTLHIRIGPMFSGKTTWLNGELTDLADKGFKVAKIIHSDDVRGNNWSKGSSHSSSYKSLTDKINIIRTDTLAKVDVNEHDVIGIDESQFFNDLYGTVREWVDWNDKHIRVAGLCGDFKKQKFGQTLDLIPIADQVVKLSASCKYCLDDLKKSEFKGNIMAISGPFTKRTAGGANQKEIGGLESYVPVCRYHHSN